MRASSATLWSMRQAGGTGHGVGLPRLDIQRPKQPLATPYLTESTANFRRPENYSGRASRVHYRPGASFHAPGIRNDY